MNIVNFLTNSLRIDIYPILDSLRFSLIELKFYFEKCFNIPKDLIECMKAFQSWLANAEILKKFAVTISATMLDLFHEAIS